MKLISFVAAWGIVGVISGPALADRHRNYNPDGVMVPGTDPRIQIDRGILALEVEQDGVRAPIPIPLAPGFADFSTGVTRVRRSGEDVELTVEQNCSKPLRLKLPVAHLRARIANVRGLKHHEAGRFDQAIEEFSAAQGMDPTATVVASEPLPDLGDLEPVPARWVGRVPGALVLSTYAPDRRGCIAETYDARVVPDK